MCGRYALTSNLDELQASFKFEARDLEYRPRFNIAPTQQGLVVTNDGSRRGEYMRWGLLPFWAKDAKAGARMINAVGETASAKPAFRAAFQEAEVPGSGQRIFRMEEGRERLGFPTIFSRPTMHLWRSLAFGRPGSRPTASASSHSPSSPPRPISSSNPSMTGCR